MGGLFLQFIDGDVDQAGSREMAAVQLAIDRVNDKYDGSYDNLLPNTQVGVFQSVFVSICDAALTSVMIFEIFVLRSNC